MQRKLAVPIVLGSAEFCRKQTRPRKLSHRIEDPEEYAILTKLAENRMRIERLEKDIATSCEGFDCSDIVNELDFLKANIQIGLLEVTNDLEEIPTSEEILQEEALA